ncbi:MAG TPA: alpha/beta fold hydrolase [Saprospiraceae bacterium]|nr:alpha/beta fold hydrolase [Saprospiraceae bacterium]
MMYKPLAAILLIIFLFQFSCKNKESHHIFPFLDGIKDLSGIKYGILKVPEDHDHPEKGTIELVWVKISPAKGSEYSEPLIFLTGGPGEHTLEYLPFLMELAEVYKREVIIYDQRGIGFSSSLPDFGKALPALFAENLTLEEEYIRLKNLLSVTSDSIQVMGQNLSNYNTFQNANDAGHIMDHFGFDQYILFGGSYGTRLGRVIMDLFPNRIKAAILDSPALFENDFIKMRIKSFAQSLELIFSYCETDSNCRSMYPDLRRDYKEGLTDLQNQPMMITLNSTDFVLNAQDAMYFLRYLMYRSNSKETVPEIIKAIKNRDTDKISEMFQPLASMMSSGNLTMFLATERFEFYDKTIDEQQLYEWYEEYGHFPAPMGLFHNLYLAAKDWMEDEADPSRRQFYPSEVPAIIFVNKYDPVTPPSNGYAMLEDLSNGFLFVLDEEGHGQGNFDCKIEVTKNFLINVTQKPDPGCLNVVLQ